MDAGERERQLAAQDEAFDRLFGAIREAAAARPDSAAKLRAAVAAALGFAAERPDEARLLVLEVVGGDRELSLQVLAYYRRLSEFMREECEGRGKAPALPEVAEQALVGAAASLIGTRLAAGEARELPALEGDLVEFLLLPYV